MSAKRLEQPEVWILAKNPGADIYKYTEHGDFKKDFGLQDQLRRASVSATSNIAEGYGRNGNKEFIQFLGIAKGSAGEIKTQLHIALEPEYISKSEFELKSQVTTSKMLPGFMNYIKQSELKGSKYNQKNFEP